MIRGPHRSPLFPYTTPFRSNMVSSLDGAAWHEGRSQPLSSQADMRIFGMLRGLADAVVVGAETVRREGYRPARPRDVFAERSEEHTSELQSQSNLVCRLLLE